MERDRRAVLIRQAAFDGVIDFSKARLLDRSWWDWLYRRLDQLEVKNRLKLYELQHAQNVMILPAASQEGVDKHWGRANELLLKMFNALFPWMASDDPTGELEKSVADLSKMWAEAWGDPNDPATQARIWQTACALDPSLRRN